MFRSWLQNVAFIKTMVSINWYQQFSNQARYSRTTSPGRRELWSRRAFEPPKTCVSIETLCYKVLCCDAKWMQLPWTCLESGTIDLWQLVISNSTLTPGFALRPLQPAHPLCKVFHCMKHCIQITLWSIFLHMPWHWDSLPSALKHPHHDTMGFSQATLTSLPNQSTCRRGAPRLGLLSKNPNTPRVEEMDVAHPRPPNLGSYFWKVC